MVAPGNRCRNGSSFPTPFWIITIVVRAWSTTGSSCATAASWSIALWAQTTKSNGPGAASAGDFTTILHG